MPRLVALVLVAAACNAPAVKSRAADGAPSSKPRAVADAAPAPVPTLPGKDMAAIVGPAMRVAAGDLDGDGKADLVLAEANTLRVVTTDGKELARAPVSGGVQVLEVGDVDGDGKPEILAGFGQTFFRREVTVLRMSLYHLAGGALTEELVAAPQTGRAEVVAMVPAPDRKGLVLAWFDSKYMVKSALATRDAGGAWHPADLATIRMATSYARGDVDGDGKPDLVVGRIYGDDATADGDAFVLRDDGKRVPVKTTRGVKSLALADSDGDGVDEIYFGDGWDRAYKAKGQGLLTWARRAASGTFTSALIEDTKGQWSLLKLVAGDLDGDGHPEIVALGSDTVRVFHRAPKSDAWTGTTIGAACRDVAIVDGAVLVLGEGDLAGTGGTSRLVKLPAPVSAGTR